MSKLSLTKKRKQKSYPSGVISDGGGVVCHVKQQLQGEQHVSSASANSLQEQQLEQQQSVEDTVEVICIESDDEQEEHIKTFNHFGNFLMATSDGNSTSNGSVIDENSKLFSRRSVPTTRTSISTVASSSAYFANLAEICHTILYDARWNTILSWQYGDDLKAIVPFAKYHCNCTTTKLHHKQQHATMITKKGLQEQNVQEEHAKFFLDQEQLKITFSKKSEITKKLEKDQFQEIDHQTDDEYELESRALLLYSRLFYRKGPWFRLDDLFCKYYCNPWWLFCRSGSEVKAEFKGREEEEELVVMEEEEERMKNNVVTKAATVVAAVAYDPLEALFTDINRLINMGLIRTFSNEIECGTITGNHRCNGGICTDLERDGILHCIGGIGRKRRKSSLSSNNNNNHRRTTSPLVNMNSKEEDGRRRSSTSFLQNYKLRKLMASQNFNTNVVIQHMKCQKTVFATTTSSKNKAAQSHINVLPVRRHMEDVILSSLARKYIQYCKETDHEMRHPRNDLNVTGGDGKKSLLKFISNYMKKFDLSGENRIACVTLCDGPLEQLRRCCRLYLIAGGGPGRMRCEAWLSVKRCTIEPDDVAKKVVDNQRILLPALSTVSTWHNISFPGLHCRLKLSTFDFAAMYEPQIIDSSVADDENSATASLRIFDRGSCGFRVWEAAAEIRSEVDRLLEAIEWCRLPKKPGGKTSATIANEKKQIGDTSSANQEGNDDFEDGDDDVDFVLQVDDVFDILTIDGRQTMVRRLLSDCNNITQADISNTNSFINENLLDLGRSKSYAMESDGQCLNLDDHDGCLDRFDNQAERLLCAISLVLVGVLRTRLVNMDTAYRNRLIGRPWLRHLQCEAVFAYCIWDGVDLMEKRKYYNYAIMMLELILGLDLGFKSKFLPCIGRDMKVFVHLLLSRRNRGKAVDRLIIDCVHLMRLSQEKSTFSTRMQTIVSATMAQEGASSSVPFSCVRGLAKRLKKPLFQTINNFFAGKCFNFEHLVLGIRLRNSDMNSGNSHSNDREKGWEVLSERPLSLVSSSKNGQSKRYFDDNDDVEKACFRKKLKRRKTEKRLMTAATKVGRSSRGANRSENSAKSQGKRNPKTIEENDDEKQCYSEWKPIVDLSVANSLSGDNRGRCAFIGWEDNDDTNIVHRHLNVEELALEDYAEGRLPVATDDCLAGGGWVGWHDEGGHVRALFRILCSQDVLATRPTDIQDCTTVFLTPYQSSPLDLHVARSSIEEASASVTRNFYLERKRSVDAFLKKLGGLDPCDICRLVHEAILSRYNTSSVPPAKGSILSRDICEIRTLSMLAAGFGGKMLASIFRCLFYDYRHYSGGMPDLLLVRAIYNDEFSTRRDLVNLDEWIGEGFASKISRKGDSKMLISRDDEFLGCSKSSESAPSSSGIDRAALRKVGKVSLEDSAAVINEPSQLELAHIDRKIKVQCVMVEVKSANDRLDGRQEDWLNILDASGNARVCKFKSSTTRSNSRKVGKVEHQPVQ